MKIYYPERFVRRHVGGNTTYAREIEEGSKKAGFEVGVIPAGKTPVATAMTETLFGLRKIRESVLHYTGDTGPLLRTHTPTVVTVHGVSSRWVSVARSKISNAVWIERVKRAIAASDHVITVSKSSSSDIQEMFDIDEGRLTVIPHGIRVESFNTPANVPESFRARLLGPYVLYVGNLEPRKNLVELINAFNSALLRDSGYTLVIAGRPAWNYGPIMAAIERARNVIYLGFVSENERTWLFQNATLFSFPSYYEGFGFPVLEAMAAGTPVACSRRGSLAEIAGPAWQMDDLSREGIASALAAALQNESWLKEARSSGKAWAEGFTWQESVNAHLSVYRLLS